MRSRSLRCSNLGGALFAAVVLWAVTVPVAAAPLYTVRELPPLEGDVSVEARALNTRGEVIGFSLNELGLPSALKWWDGGSEVLYPAKMDDSEVVWGATAVDINDLGVAVGTAFGWLKSSGPPYYGRGAEGTGPVVWGAGDFREPKCTLDDGAAKISNAGVVLNWTPCVYTIDPADAARLEVGNAVGRRLYENGLVLNDAGTLGQALWGGKPEDESWDRGWYETDLSTCGASTSEGSAWEAPWDAYICELASTGYERSRTVNARGQYIVNEGNRAFLYTPVSEPPSPVSEPPSLAMVGLLLAILVAVRRSARTAVG
jgi:hypothetical protein